MSDKFQECLDKFVKNLIIKIDNKEIIPMIQQEYDELMEVYQGLAVLTIEEFESLDKTISDYDSKLKELQEEIKTYKTQKINDQDKIKQMMDELANNIELNERYKKLNNEYNILQQKYNSCHTDNIDNQLKLKNNEKQIINLQNEIKNLKKENFDKFEKLSIIEKEFKLNEIKLSQALEKLSKFSTENNELSRKNMEIKNNYIEQQKTYQNRLLILEKQINHLSEANQNFVQENSKVQTQLKDFQIYTSMAKINKKNLNKEDFSILETMSKRAENAELEVQKLLSYINDLKNVNEKLRNKIKPLENYALLQIKHDREINTGNDTTYEIKNRIFTDDEMEEINKLKNEPNALLNSLLKLKTENLELHNQLKDITIECNQLLRDAKLRKENY